MLLLRQLHTKEFHWTVPNDDNRAKDGCMLREKFYQLDDGPTVTYIKDHGESDILEGPCSMLEMLVALADRYYDLVIENDKVTVETCFWDMIKNLKLDIYTDESYVDLGGNLPVDDILDVLLERRYDKNGVGGLFPLNKADKDQRKVEIWYQLSAYLMENNGENYY